MAIKSDSPDKRMKEIFAYVLEFILTFDKMQNTKIYQNFTNKTILCTRRMQPPCSDCAVRVQWFSNVQYEGHLESS